MDDQKPSSEDKDSESADGNVAAGESTVGEGEPAKLAEGIPAPPEEKASVSFTSDLQRRCSLCNTGNGSPHGQGELQRFDPSPKWMEMIKHVPKRVTSCPKSSVAKQFCGDLSRIGFVDSMSPEELFEPTGHCWVHHWCASWSADVWLEEGVGLVNVDKAVFSGISQKCEYCTRNGATIRCHSEGCLRLYHFPCAAASGSFQSLKTFKLLCSEHLDQAVALDGSCCVVCDGPGDLQDLLFCTGCGLHYHGACLDVTVTPLKRSGWQCPECKVCQTCRLPGLDSKMLVCDTCDKGYHTFCLKPPIENMPMDSWKCKNCRMCRGCGSWSGQMDAASQWYENYSLCENCQQQRNHDVVCALCGSVGHVDTMQRCPRCLRFTHTQCEGTLNRLPSDYSCLACRALQNTVSNMTTIQEHLESKAKPLISGAEDPGLPHAAPEPAFMGAKLQMGVEKLSSPMEDVFCSPPMAKEHSEDSVDPRSPVHKETLDTRLCPQREECFVTILSRKDKEVGNPCEVGFREQDLPAGLLTLSNSESRGSFFTSPSEALCCTVLHSSPTSPSALCRSENGDTVKGDDPQSSAPNTDSTEATSFLPHSPSGEGCNTSVMFAHGHKNSDSEMLLETEECSHPTPMEVFSADKLSRTERSSLFDIELNTRTKSHAIKSDIVNEISNLSQGDTAGSYHCSEPMGNEISNLSQGATSGSSHGYDPMGSPDQEGGSLSMDLCMVSTDISLQKDDCLLQICTDSMPDMDDSQHFDSSGMKIECEKTRRRSSPGRSRVKQGRSSSFPGRRRPRGGNGGGCGSRGRGRSRLKSTTSSIETLALADIDSSPSKEEEDEEDDTMQNTVVLFSNTDKFVLMQDMCVVCGSFGRGTEGHLLACSQCSQCYHPYCVNSKITKVMLLKGWRCVECIVCEVCGKASDPSRLLLCDDCDISYHTYCLDPPLHTVPKGGWKCKWCVCCMQCGAASPGFHAEWQNNYTHCAPCASLVTCPVCRLKYVEDDLLIQCQNCERWLHAMCENLFTEEEVEEAADEGFDCAACQPFVIKPVVPVIVPEVVVSVKVKEPEPEFFRFEGVWLTETGMSALRSLTLSPVQKRKQRRSRLSTSGEVGIESVDLTGQDDKKEEGEMEVDEMKVEAISEDLMDCEIKLEPPATPEQDAGSGLEPGQDCGSEMDPAQEGAGEMEPGQEEGVDLDSSRQGDCEMEPDKGSEELDDSKKKKRKPYRPGIGGFMVRQRKSHTRTKKGLAALFEAQREAELEAMALNAELQQNEANHGDGPKDGAVETGTSEGDEKKKRRGRKKSKLEDMFPAYLQEAFFGKDLIDLTRKALLSSGDATMRQSTQKTKSDSISSMALKGAGDGLETTPNQKGEEELVTTALTGHEVCSTVLEAKTENPELPKMENTDIQQLLKDVLGPPEREHFPNCVASGLEDGCGNREICGAPLPRPSIQETGSLGTLTPLTPVESYPTSCQPQLQDNTLQRWEKDEDLGELSTISPVLYSNMNFPKLRQDYPDWSNRCKQIMKLWRKVPAPDKAPYLQKAKDNRAAQRINKQAESQISKQSKVDGIRKAERPTLHLRIPSQSGSQGFMPSTPESRGSSSAGQSVFLNSSPIATPNSDGFFKPSSAGTTGSESPSEPFFKLPPQSPGHVPLHGPFGNGPAYPIEPRCQSSLVQSPTSVGFQNFSPVGPQLAQTTRPIGQTMECHITPPGTPRHQSAAMDAFLKPRYSSGSLDNLSVPGSPSGKPSPLGECGSKSSESLMSPSHFVDHKKQLDFTLMHIKKEDSCLHSKHDITQAMIIQDTSLNTQVSNMEMKNPADVFKAPLTPRVTQVEPHSPASIHRNQDLHGQGQGSSPQHHMDIYRQSPSVSYTDPYAQMPLTPRSQAAEACCTLPPRSLPSDPFTRVPASPQPQSNSQSPLTPRPLSTEAFCQSPIAPRFQSPDPYSRPPSRPQSRDPFAPIHKPPRPQILDPGFKAMQVSHSSSGGGFQQSLPPSLSAESHPRVQVSPHQIGYARSPGTGVFSNPQGPLSFTFPQGGPESVKTSPSHQPNFSQPHHANTHYTPPLSIGKTQVTNCSSPGFHQTGSPLPGSGGGPETYTLSPLRPPSVLQQDGPYMAHNSGQRSAITSPAEKRDDVLAISSPMAAPVREGPELQVNPDTTLSNLSQTEHEKQRQRQRLRELLIRQQIQRNTLRQEKEAAAAAANSSQSTWSVESNSQTFDQTGRGVSPYLLAQDKAGLVTPTSTTGKVPSSSQAGFAHDDRLSRPPPSATPSSVDAVSRQTAGGLQSYYPRAAFSGPPQQPPMQQLWQGQQPSVVNRVQHPPSLEMNRSASSSSIGHPPSGTGDQIPISPSTVGAPYIELRHNTQKGKPGAACTPFIQQTPPPRSRFFLASEEIGRRHHHSLDSLRAPSTPMQELHMQPQKTPTPINTSPQNVDMGELQHTHSNITTSLSSAAELPSQHIPCPALSSACTIEPEHSKDDEDCHSAPIGTTSVTSKTQVAPESGRLPPEETVEPDLEDDFDTHKDLEDDDDLANLGLDPDVAKGDDDLGNLDNLETNDPHLDDLLNGDEFDLLAYTDPELDTGDKKDIFNEHLRLVESANEKAEKEALLKKEPSDSCVLTSVLPVERQKENVPTENTDQKSRVMESIGCPSVSTLPATDKLFDSSLKVPAVTENKIEAFSANITPKLEENCLKMPTCEFPSSHPQMSVNIKTEVVSNADKIASPVGSQSLKADQCLLSPGGRTAGLNRTTNSLSSSSISFSQFSNQRDPTPCSENGPLTSVSPVSTQNTLSTHSSSILEKFDLASEPLGLSNDHHSSADELDKMESSLVANELPLLIEDLLEHEKKELQKKQLISSHHPGGSQHLQVVQPHTNMGHPSGPNQHMLPMQQSLDGPYTNLVGPPQQLQLGLLGRQHSMVSSPHLLSQQHQVQQRISGPQAGQVLTQHMTVAQGQGHVIAGQQMVQSALPPQQSPKQVAGVQPQQIGMKAQQVVMQQQLANSFFPDADLDTFATEDIIDPIAKAKMVALKGIKKVMAQGSIGVAPVINRQQVSLLAQRLSGPPGLSEVQNHLPSGITQERGNTDALPQARPNPPTFAQGVINEADQRQYEEWLYHTQQLLQMQLKALEEQIGVHRKSRKALCAKQRTAKKAGREFPEAEAEKLKLVTEQQGKIQKQLDQVRKQQKEHTNLMAEYRNKQQQHQQHREQQQTPTAMVALSPSQSPQLIAKVQGQILSRQALPQQVAQAGNASGASAAQGGSIRVPQGGVSGQVQQGIPFANCTIMQQGPTQGGNTSVSNDAAVFFPGSSPQRGLVNDSRLLQDRERQLQLQQQRIQLAQRLQKQGILGQPSLQQGMVSQQQNQSNILGPQQQQPPLQSPQAPQMASSKQGVVVQQLSPQQASVIPHQGVISQHNQQRHILLSQQQRILGSSQQSILGRGLSQQQQGVLGSSPVQQQGLMSQTSPQKLSGQMTLVSQPQMGVISQAQALMAQPDCAPPHPPVMGQAQTSQQGLFGQSQNQTTSQHFLQQSVLHLSHIMSPTNTDIQSKDAAGILSQEDTKGQTQQQSIQFGPGGLNQAGQETASPQQVTSQAEAVQNRNTSVLVNTEHVHLPMQHQSLAGDQQQNAQKNVMGPPQHLQQSPRVQNSSMTQQQGPIASQQGMQNSGLIASGVMNSRSEQPLVTAQQQEGSQKTTLLEQQGAGDQPVVTGQQQRLLGPSLIPSQSAEQQAKGIIGQLQNIPSQQQQPMQNAGQPRPRLMGQHQGAMLQQTQAMLGQPTSQMLGHIRAQLQGVIAKNPQLRNLTPQQQQQLHTLLVQRHQQSLLQQSQAMRAAGQLQGQAPALLDHGSPVTTQHSSQGTVGRQLPPGTVLHVRPLGPSTPVEQQGFVGEQLSSAQQRPLSELGMPRPQQSPNELAQNTQPRSQGVLRFSSPQSQGTVSLQTSSGEANVNSVQLQQQLTQQHSQQLTKTQNSQQLMQQQHSQLLKQQQMSQHQHLLSQQLAQQHSQQQQSQQQLISQQVLPHQQLTQMQQQKLSQHLSQQLLLQQQLSQQPPQQTVSQLSQQQVHSQQQLSQQQHPSQQHLSQQLATQLSQQQLSQQLSQHQPQQQVSQPQISQQQSSQQLSQQLPQQPQLSQQLLSQQAQQQLAQQLSQQALISQQAQQQLAHQQLSQQQSLQLSQQMSQQQQSHQHLLQQLSQQQQISQQLSQQQLSQQLSQQQQVSQQPLSQKQQLSLQQISQMQQSQPQQQLSQQMQVLQQQSQLSQQQLSHPQAQQHLSQQEGLSQQLTQQQQLSQHQSQQQQTQEQLSTQHFQQLSQLQLSQQQMSQTQLSQQQLSQQLSQQELLQQQMSQQQISQQQMAQQLSQQQQQFVHQQLSRHPVSVQVPQQQVSQQQMPHQMSQQTVSQQQMTQQLSQQMLQQHPLSQAAQQQQSSELQVQQQQSQQHQVSHQQLSQQLLQHQVSQEQQQLTQQLLQQQASQQQLSMQQLSQQPLQQQVSQQLLQQPQQTPLIQQQLHLHKQVQQQQLHLRQKHLQQQLQMAQQLKQAQSPQLQQSPQHTPHPLTRVLEQQAEPLQIIPSQNMYSPQQHLPHHTQQQVKVQFQSLEQSPQEPKNQFASLNVKEPSSVPPLPLSDQSSIPDQTLPGLDLPETTPESPTSLENKSVQNQTMENYSSKDYRTCSPLQFVSGDHNAARLEPNSPLSPLKTASPKLEGSSEAVVPEQDVVKPILLGSSPVMGEPPSQVNGGAEGQESEPSKTHVQSSDSRKFSDTEQFQSIRLNIKQEPKDEVPCMLENQAVKREASGDPVGLKLSGKQLFPGCRSEAGHLLLQKLLRAKNVQLASQRSVEGMHAEINGHINSKLAVLEQKLQAAPGCKEDISVKKAVAKPKRSQKVGDKVPNSRKKTKKEEGLKSTEEVMKQLKQELSLLPLMEPAITANFSLFSPFGSSPLNGKHPLKGVFGNAALDSVPDYYTQLLTKNNLSNPPTPPSSLPPTPPPSVQQKMVNGVTSEDLRERHKDSDSEASREAESQKVICGSEVKKLDLLAALPTPPHNQTEDVRMESDEENENPDSIVPASSPESVLEEETTRFPLLTDLKVGRDDRALSPVIPLIPRVCIPAFPERKPFDCMDVFPEHAEKVVLTATAGQGISWEKGTGSEVSVMLTVSTAAAKNLNGVVAAVAGLLSIKIPNSYVFPEGSAGNQIEMKKPVPESVEEEEIIRKDKPAVVVKGPQKSSEWLKQFDTLLPGYTLKNDVDILSLLTQEPPAIQKVGQHRYVNKVSNLDVRQLPNTPEESSPPMSPFVQSPSSTEPKPQELEYGPESGPLVPDSPLPPSPPPPSPPVEELREIVKLKQRSRPSEDNDEMRPRIKKWKGLRWKRLRILITIQKGGAKRDGEKEISEFIEKLGTTLRPEMLPTDLRKCCFCHEEGDGATDGPARLLNLDLDLWVHLNCALWSTEVYETQGGALINVEVALHRGLLTKCSVCQKTGATNSCNRIRCPNVYHFACAIRAKCMFFKDKTMLCPMHKLKGPCDHELSSFAVFRRVYIERDEVNQIASIIQRGERIHMFRVGGLIFHAIGQLLPHQLADFHSVTALYPVGYEATRIYWSMRYNNRRCCYRCSICDDNGQPEFTVQVIEYGHEDIVLSDSSAQAVWNQIVEPVARMRRELDMLRLFPEYLKGEDLFGLTLHAVVRIAESLPGVENCQDYLFRYGRHPLMELPLMINPTGCARSEPKILTHYKRPHTLNSTSMSKAYQSTFTGETNTPYSKQFVHSKSSQYRRLKTEWKNNVYLARSRIQGLGLYASKDIEKHTMVIEYIGTIIRNEVANRREKIYEEQNRGIYMFRINNEHVIDATLTGGPARYINHSCAPNCVAEVVTFDKEDKIIIISSRRIPKGEELTYDYQFDFEDDQHKIPCHCGAWNCRKWMN
ncbi:histone-lysine N-methyltransferase 2D isoform X2 [Pleurodeles waltl]|uniref:histone-lysine N-methyltransferase 2D isoform X2 n=1 Tax=Pleurodeles waltl TaxID=8319 RepID=UPI003709857C